MDFDIAAIFESKHWESGIRSSFSLGVFLVVLPGNLR